MCGIAGFVNRHGSGNPDPYAVVARIAGTLHHRGPDDRGTWTTPNGRVGLGHCRLSILDPSSAGRQPMVSDDGRMAIVYNGEIYNFRELRSELEGKGDRFRTSTDTEVLLAAYRRYGSACLPMFNGMFAFAIWDGEKQELFLARDRYGVRPLLYYYREADLFLFASEMKAIHAYGSLSLSPDLPALRRYLYLSYIPSPETAYREVKRLDAGHFLVLTKDSLRCERWYDLAPAFAAEKLIREEEGERLLRDTFEEAVRARLVSDVPLGAFLSGGLDSSLVVGLMARNSTSKVRTFTIGYHDNPVYDESAYARQTSDFFGTEHTEVMLSVRDGLEAIPEVLDSLDQPFGDSSAIPTYLISRETRKSVKAALSGDGGDEVFAGYSKYQAEAYANWYGMVPAALGAMLRKGVANFPEGRGSRLHEIFRRVKKAVRSAEPDQVIRHCALMFPLAEEEMRAIVPGDAPAEIRAHVAESMNRVRGEAIDRALFTDIHLCLKDDMLVKADLMGMANSLEVRSPFLDHRVVELAARMPGRWKLKGTRRKHILFSAFRELLPPFLRTRKKQGFGIPVGEWLRKDLKVLFEDIVSRNAVNRTGVMDYEEVNKVYRAHLSGKRDATPLLWSVLAFQWWARKYL